MVLIDDRTGSKELESHISKWGTDTYLTRLEYGDFAFEGVLDDRPVFIGLERKTLSDLLECIKDKRFAQGQLPGMHETYDYRYLIVEGMWRPNDEGLLQELRAVDGKFKWTNYSPGGHRWMYTQVSNYLTSVEMAGFYVRRSQNKPETGRMVVDLYNWWQKSQHTSLLSLRAGITNIEVRRPSFMRRVAAELPGVGYTLSSRAEAHFESVYDMITANWQRWAEIDKIGEVKAKALVAAIRAKTKVKGKENI